MYNIPDRRQLTNLYTYWPCSNTVAVVRGTGIHKFFTFVRCLFRDLRAGGETFIRKVLFLRLYIFIPLSFWSTSALFSNNLYLMVAIYYYYFRIHEMYTFLKPAKIEIVSYYDDTRADICYRYWWGGDGYSLRPAIIVNVTPQTRLGFSDFRNQIVKRFRVTLEG